MAMLKINPAKLPDRGNPTKDIKPVFDPPRDAKVVQVKNISYEQAHERWKERKMKHFLRGGEKSKTNRWTEEMDETAMRMYWAGESYEAIGKAVGRTAGATNKRINIIRRAQGLRPRPMPESPNNNLWQEWEDERMIKLWNAGANARGVSLVLGTRTASAVSMRLAWLRSHTNIYIRYGKARH